MGAFSIAFDTIIVGALSLPWVLLVIHLFFSANESRLEKILQWVKKQNQPALAGVLLFAMAYPMGSAVSRIAQDFFDDDDLHFPISNYLFRVGVTESSIRTDSYCRTFMRLAQGSKHENNFAQGEGSNPAKTPVETQGTDAAKAQSSSGKKIPKGCTPEIKVARSEGADEPELAEHSEAEPSPTGAQMQTPDRSKYIDEQTQTFERQDPKCQYTGKWFVKQGCFLKGESSTGYVWLNREALEAQEERADNIFRYQEAAVMLRGTDANERLRQYHDQIMVLRGAAFNGMIALSLCLFWWAARVRSWPRWTMPLIPFVPGVVATVNHFHDHLDDPPYMEFTFLVLAAAGWYLIWQTRPRWPGTRWRAPSPIVRGEIRLPYILLCLFLTVSAFLGWWATQGLYNQQVIYSYKAGNAPAASPAGTASATPTP